MRAAVYARVSTERQGRDQTIDSQLEALRGWAAAHGHELKREHVFIDEGYSGSRLDRPALDRLRDAAREGEFDVVAVYSPDRLARRYAYQVVLLEEFRRAGCDVEFVHRPISDDPHDQLLLQIQGAVAEYERAVLGERFRRGKLQKARAGHWTAGQVPLRLSLRPGPRRRPGAPGGRRGRGRGGPDALPLADRRADDRPPDPQAARRRPVAAAVRQAALVELRRPPHPVRPGLHRHRLRQPARLRRAPQAAVDRPQGGHGDVPTAQAARGVDPDPGPGHRSTRRRIRMRRIAARPQLGPVVPEQHPQRLPAAVPADLPDVRPGDVRGHDVRQAGPGREHRYYKCHGKDTVARDRACRCTQTPAKVDELDAAVWGHVKALLEDPAALAARFEELARAVGGEGRRPGRGPAVGGPTAAARPRGATAGRRLPGRGDRPGRVEGPPRADPGPAAGPGHPARPGAAAAGRASGGEGGLVGPGGVLPPGAIPARRGDASRSVSGSCNC